MLFNIWVAGWSRTREVTVENGEIALEVARISCSHCATCSGRLQAIRQRVGRESREDYRGGGVLVILSYPATEEQTPEAAAKFLAGKIGLRTLVAE
jgi:hypothetical protein